MAPWGCGCSPETRQPRTPWVPSVAAVGSTEDALAAQRMLLQQQPMGAAPQPRFSWPASTAVLQQGWVCSVNSGVGRNRSLMEQGPSCFPILNSMQNIK